MAPKPKIEDKYVKLTPIQHVLHRSSMYLGSIEPERLALWLLNIEGTLMEKREITYIPGLFKIFDEIIANASDHYFRLKASTEEDINLVKNIKVNIDKATGIITVFNDGNGIEVVEHPEHKIYIPQLVLGNLMSSSNYNDEVGRTGIGVNGVGGTAANIFSKVFTVETVDSTRKLMYKQKFETNMSITNTPVISKCSKKPYTIIEFLPEYSRFGLEVLSDDMYEVFRKRVYDLCAIVDKDVNIYFNDEKLEFKSFEKYVDLYLGSKSSHTRVYEHINNSWDVIASYSNTDEFEAISFVNGILVIKNGKHVDYILNQIIKKLTDLIVKKNKNVTIKPTSIKDNLILFIKCTIINPTFNSQSKETLTTPIIKFGSKAEISDVFITKLFKSGIVERLLEISAQQQEKKLAKTDGTKKNTIRGLPKLEDATWAGTARSKECLLILCEGDSASSMAISGISQVGREKYGVFPLKGKVMNVRDMVLNKIADNQEITNIKKILGLENGKKYTDLDDLRYGGIMLMCDADSDGSHIKGLLFNLIHTLWPSLMTNFNFLCSLQTPIIKVKKGAQTIQFYTITEYDAWKSTIDNPNSWHIKHYKGLATSDISEAKEYFKEMRKVTYTYTEKTNEHMELAFDKKKADLRKEWLYHYERENILDYKDTHVTYDDFINKELIHFSNYDVERSIPNVIDGLKTSLRKILYSCFKRNLTDKEIRVAQLAAYVSENAAYHHGEASLQGAIVNMAQDFVGSNNINLLKPIGIFGSRLHNGKDAGQPRYIHTMLTDLASCIYKKQDIPLLTYLDDDGFPVEPEYYVPTIPMLLVNGGLGIGTGFSTSVPCYNPLDIIRILRKLISGDTDIEDIMPWYRGFKGEIKTIEGKTYCIGVFKRTTQTKIEITEIPIGYSTFDFKADLETALDNNPEFKKYENNSAGDIVHFTLYFANADYVDKLLKIERNGFTKLENDFKLVSSKYVATTNMYAFDHNRKIKKYESAIEIIEEFYAVRFLYYKKRKDYILAKLQYDADIMANKIRFIKEVVAETLVVHKMKKADLEKYLEDNEYMIHEASFDYIIRIPVYNLTTDKVLELEANIEKAVKEIEDLTNKTIESIWSVELDEFILLYRKHLESFSSKKNK